MDSQKQKRIELQKLEEKFKNLIHDTLQFVKKAKNSLPQNDPPIPIPESKPKIIFDTDIGSDIDDALALLLLLHLPKEDYELLGVTTVYGYTGIRAGVAKKIIEAHEKDINQKLYIPVIPGSNVPINDHYIIPIWHAKTEGIGLFNDEEIENMKKRNYFADKFDCLEASDFIVEQVTKFPNEVIIISLGALTNIAKAILKDPELPKKVKRLVFMGTGVVPYNQPVPSKFESDMEYHCHSCHNVRTDASAAHIVFKSGMNIYTVGHKVTHDMWFKGPIVERMRGLSYHKGKNPYKNDDIIVINYNNELIASHVVGTLFDVWLKHRSTFFMRNVDGTCPHDGLTTCEAIYPGRLLEFVKGHLIVNETNGHTCFIYDPIGGNVNMAIGWKKDGLDKFMKLLNLAMVEILDKNKVNEIFS